MQENYLSAENARWLEDFKHINGRSPSVLHIGNIANNAYNNAKLLISAGIDCDVICYNYYHIMGCYEWEDVEFSGPILDPFKPNWIAAGIKTCNRPKWFAQGPIKICIEYLVAKRRRDQDAAEMLWEKLEYHSGYSFFDKGPPFVQKSINSITKLWKSIRRILHKGKKAYKSFLINTIDKNILANIINDFLSTVRNKENKLKQNIANLDCYKKQLAVARLMQVTLGILRASFSLTMLSLRVMLKALRMLARLPKILLTGRPLKDDPSFKNMVYALLARYREEFPTRKDVMSYNDLNSYENIMPLWQRLFEHYDFIIAYSTDPIIPMLANKDFFALEHGTIRDIPYQDTSVGRATALAYRLAKHVFVTNSDCVSSAEKLSPGRYTLINHPYDEDHGLAVSGWEEDRERLCRELHCEMLFFFPTRHDWVPGTGYADKANDIFIRAIGALHSMGLSLGIVCCQWGQNVKQSKTLINELGLSQHVKWVEPMAIISFERMARAAHCIVDQFSIGAFGGVLFKAMAVGAPTLTYLNESLILQQYPQCPPVINCRTEEDIIESIKELYASPEKLTKIGSAARAWMVKYHLKGLIINAQLDQFRASSQGTLCSLRA